MQILYTYKECMDPIFIEGTEGTMRVLLVFREDGDTFVYYCSDVTHQVFINRIISTRLLGFTLSNFARIEDDEQFQRFQDYIETHYNYNGQHMTDKIDGHDRGGLVVGRDV